MSFRPALPATYILVIDTAALIQPALTLVRGSDGVYPGDDITNIA
jgi:hypothetical protein